MSLYLEFRNAKCKDCYKCLRECPVKAIDIKGHQAEIIEDRCILCGHCTLVCPQNAKVVHSEINEVRALLAGPDKVIASVAPSFISSFGLSDFGVMKLALAKLGFFDAEETAVGAQAVTQEYANLLKSGQFKNFITSACPAVCRMIQEYYPMALKYLAPVDSPMVAHAKILKKQHPEAKIVFVGPCIAKKREAEECHLIDNVLTFEDVVELFKEKGVQIDEITNVMLQKRNGMPNLAKEYPIPQGIIHSFPELPEGYDYIAIDGPMKCVKALQNIEHMDHVVLEMNLCEDACVNGPCSLEKNGGSVKAMSDIRKYVSAEKRQLTATQTPVQVEVPLATAHPRIRSHSMPAPEREIEAILHKTGKFKPEDELDCGSCGYATCREKAWAVYNGYADIDICLPYMRQRAESFSVEVIQNSPEGIVVLDPDMNILEINRRGRELLGIEDPNAKGHPAIDYFNPIDFCNAYAQKKNIELKKELVTSTGKYVDLSINYLANQNLIFGIMKDVTDTVDYEKRIMKVKMETLTTTDDVIKKQMRVAQEIASLLGETTAETKVALLKLKKTLTEEKVSE
ncbi:MAG: 4Fe-4S binding protein [Bacteroidales bacterium]|nr:4Fe-4S binding protein [Bacteroidales bacterium]MBR4646649.1 4Fe-4S binding protein [Bacteroidales bacterium]